MEPVNILLVEDDVFLSQLLKTRMEREGFVVSAFMNGDGVLAELNKKKFDLILLDVILPQKSGFEIMEEIEKMPAADNVPVIIISNLGQEADIKRGKDLGAIGYYIKSKTPLDELIKKVKSSFQT